MLTYFLPGYNNYKIRTNQIPSGSTFLRVCTQNMLTLEDYCFLLNPGQWSYDPCESTVDISFNLDIALDVNVGDEYRLYLTPAITNSVTPFTYLDDIWHGSLQVFYSQSVNKPAYVNQIPLEDIFISEDTANTFVYWSQTQPPGPTTTTTTGAPTTTTTAAPTTTTTSTTTTSTTTTSTTTTTTTAAPGTPDLIITLGNLYGGMGFNQCISGVNNTGNGAGVIFSELKTFLSSDAACITPYGTSWDKQSFPGIFFNPGTTTTGSFATTSGGSIIGNYWRTRYSGSFDFDVPVLGIGFTSDTTFDLTGTQYKDYTKGGFTVRIQGPNCKLNNYVDCTPAAEVTFRTGKHRNQFGLNVCFYADNNLPVPVELKRYDYKMLASTSSLCDTGSLVGDWAIYGYPQALSPYTQLLQASSSLTNSFQINNSGGDIYAQQYYVSIVSGSITIEYPTGSGNISPFFNYELSGSNYKDFDWSGIIVRVLGPNCTPIPTSITGC